MREVHLWLNHPQISRCGRFLRHVHIHSRRKQRACRYLSTWFPSSDLSLDFIAGWSVRSASAFRKISKNNRNIGSSRRKEGCRRIGSLSFYAVSIICNCATKTNSRKQASCAATNSSFKVFLTAFIVFSHVVNVNARFSSNRGTNNNSINDRIN